MQIDHILPKTHQHFRSALPVDTPVDIGLAGKVILKLPIIGDRVAEKHDATLAIGRSCQRLVSISIATKLSEVVCIDADPRRAVLIEIGIAGGGNARSRLLSEESHRLKHQEQN